jgi:hypothetical protein
MCGIDHIMSITFPRTTTAAAHSLLCLRVCVAAVVGCCNAYLYITLNLEGGTGAKGDTHPLFLVILHIIRVIAKSNKELVGERERDIIQTERQTDRERQTESVYV